MIRFMLMLLVLSLAGCSSMGVLPHDDGVTFVVVRHAEKAIDDPQDPNLSDVGQARAQRLAARLANAPLIAVHVTEFRRTRQTAQPAADAHRVTPTPYSSQAPFTEVAAQWLRTHRHGTVLIVGHSNTVPGLVSALSGQEASAMSDDEYDRLTRIHITADGAVRVEIERY